MREEFLAFLALDCANQNFFHSDPSIKSPKYLITYQSFVKLFIYLFFILLLDFSND